MAIGNDKDNLSFVGPDGTDQSYFVTNGDDLDDASNNALVGRYAQYRAVLSGDGTLTPELARVELSHSGDVASQLHQYAYDAQSNMTSKVIWDDASRLAGVPASSETRTYNTMNQLTQNVIVEGGITTTWSFAYNAAGNMISKTDGTDTYTYEWSYDDRLTAVKLNGTAQASYEYDSMGRMLKRTVGTNLTTFKWDGWNLLQEQGPGLETLYIAPEGEIMAVHVGGNSYQLHADQVGSVHTVTNANGNVVAEQVLDPWGVRLQATGISFPCSGFVGKYGIREDSATGLIYMRNRWYDPQLQRFMSADPISIAGGLNLYAYAGADPVNNTDLTGLITDEETWYKSQSPHSPCPTGDERATLAAAYFGILGAAGVVAGGVTGYSAIAGGSILTGSGILISTAQDANIMISGDDTPLPIIIPNITSAIRRASIEGARAATKAGARRLSRDIIPTYNGKKLEYLPRIRSQALGIKDSFKSQASHNYPYSFDQKILDNGPIGSHTNAIGETSISFGLEGHIGNSKGMFEIGVNEQTSMIVHRSFRGYK